MNVALQDALIQESQLDDLEQRGYLNKYLDTLLYCYRYIFKTKDNPEVLGVKIVTDIRFGHNAFMQRISKDENVISCVREYLCCYDIDEMFITTTVKQDTTAKQEVMEKGKEENRLEENQLKEEEK